MFMIAEVVDETGRVRLVLVPKPANDEDLTDPHLEEAA
jgi:hypothetical protein